MIVFLILSLLASKQIKEKKKLLNSLYMKFREKCKIKNKIIEWKTNGKEFNIVIYCLKKILILKKKKNF